MRKLFAGLALFFASLGVTAVSAQTTARTAPAVAMQFYTLDGGHLDFKNMGAFSDTGEHEGEPGSIAVPCYLIHHGKDWLLWDTGLGDKIAAEPNGEYKFGGHFTVRRTLKSQLAQIGLKPDDIHYVALSHLHSDHSGNTVLFPQATFLVAAVELTWARGVPTPGGVEPALIAPLADAHVSASDEDKDVFGDGTVQTLKAPGHTPGHRMLLVKLAPGYLLISGDLYHTRENYEKGLIPNENVSRADTLASFARFARVRDNTHARVIIQHSPADFAALPAFPKFLD